ncbi:MAG: WhiB family transcriptional regulator [Acidimicrobiia bacterium]|nr:WhiB family transcriptional regulator [Acidimicrobiia bacterium]
MNDDHDLIEFALSVPVTDERPWAVFAACKDADPNTFFPTNPEGERRAIRICNGCSVQMECLEFALETRARYGIWGGQTEKQRRALERRIA